MSSSSPPPIQSYFSIEICDPQPLSLATSMQESMDLEEELAMDALSLATSKQESIDEEWAMVEVE